MKHPKGKLERQLVDAKKDGCFARSSTWSPNGERKDHRKNRRQTRNLVKQHCR